MASERCRIGGVQLVTARRQRGPGPSVGDWLWVDEHTNRSNQLIMYIAIDVQYAADDAHATIAGVLFRDPMSPVVDDELVVVTRAPKPYIPGQF